MSFDDAPNPGRRPLRIAFVTETYPPEVNGVALTVARLVDGLRQRGHDVQLFRPRQPGDPGGSGAGPGHEVLLHGAPIPCYPHLRMGLPALRRLHALWTQRRPDIVHVATEGPLGWSAVRVASRLGLPLSSDFRTNFQAYSAHYRVGWLGGVILGYLRRFHNDTGCTMVPTEALRGELKVAGFERLAVVARGVDTQLFSPARRSEDLRRHWGAGERGRVALYVGRLAAEKNLDLLLDSHAAMRRHDPTLRLVLVGDGPLGESLRQRCPDAVFAGQRRGADLAAHYASADVFVFPSLTETFGNVTPEAMASGLPVLAFDHAAAGQLIEHGVSGWLAPHGDAATFVTLAVELARNAALSRHAGRAARQTVLELGWEGIARQVESVFLSTLVARRAPERASALLTHWGPT